MGLNTRSSCLSLQLETPQVQLTPALVEEVPMLGAMQLPLPIPDCDGVTRQPRPAPTFSANGEQIFKQVRRRDGTTATCFVTRRASTADLAADFDLSWLRSRERPPATTAGRSLRTVDLFAGCGAMSVGIREACRALELPVEFALGAELDPIKASVYQRNLQPLEVLTGDIEQVLDGRLGEPATVCEQNLVARIGSIDILIGGPPCQGHSDLNNHTRRNDARNRLLTRMARFAELFAPQYIFIENVQGVKHDHLKVASATAVQLRQLGYAVEEIIVDCAALGVPQTRRRYMSVGARGRSPQIKESLLQVAKPARPVSWAISDLLDVEARDVFDTSAVHSPENERRIRFLFEQNIYDLPDEQRPACHRTKAHSYRSVYGRMSWDQPAQTITTGFGSTGQGRFVHPLRRRTLTPHEAARLQTIPDFFDFGEVGRTQLQKMIGNSVPPLAMVAVALQLFR